VSISEDKKIFVKRAFIYLAISAFLVGFNLVYSIFAHGIGSDYMQYAFLLPLIGGSVMSLLLILLPRASDTVCHLWRMGITTLVTGSLLHGVFDIYGSEVALVKVFFVVGGILLISSFIVYIINIIQTNK